MSSPSVADALAARHRPVDLAPPEAPRHLRLVGEEELAAIRRHRRVRVGVALLTAFVIGLLSAAVWMHVVLAQNQVRLDAVTAKANAAQAAYQQLRLQVDQLSSPARILAIAEGQLHMTAPPSVTYTGPAGTSSGLPPATAPSGWSTVKSQLAAGA